MLSSGVPNDLNSSIYPILRHSYFILAGGLSTGTFTPESPFMMMLFFYCVTPINPILSENSCHTF